MSWSKLTKTIAGNENWLVATETVTITATTGDQTSSVIDFIPYGKDFILWMDHANTLAATGHIDIQYSDSSGGTFADLATTGLGITTTAQTGSSTARDLIDVSAKTCYAPYMKLNIDKSATMAATADTDTIKFTILCPPNNGIVY